MKAKLLYFLTAIISASAFSVTQSSSCDRVTGRSIKNSLADITSVLFARTKSNQQNEDYFFHATKVSKIN